MTCTRGLWGAIAVVFFPKWGREFFIVIIFMETIILLVVLAVPWTMRDTTSFRRPTLPIVFTVGIRVR